MQPIYFYVRRFLETYKFPTDEVDVESKKKKKEREQRRIQTFI